MLILFGILIVLACVLLAVFVLVQNPKGGGLSGSFGGIGTQVIGVRQTTDVLEKGTWILATIIAVLCLTSSIFIGKGGQTGATQDKSIFEKNAGKAAPVSAPAQAPQPPAGNTVTLPADSGK
ncbi:preprotein translocase subunit SecG [Chitinophaga skermanii]|uniref:Protein-export membrane protein SecG n=1 Tax=Chitinophaga skermanii TaxID=331697 RepID=A0A327QPI9_9BACT|nr:preprotein translocase subunit SecG [Chitinophaga skermanii]RAJ05263.1 preprotein translocase subunit SecG [Chitinophaga skermanii]